MFLFHGYNFPVYIYGGNLWNQKKLSPMQKEAETNSTYTLANAALSIIIWRSVGQKHVFSALGFLPGKEDGKK